MRTTLALRRWCIRATFFTRPGCSLCVDANKVIHRVWDRRPFELSQVDISEAQHQKWKEIYDFDVPVIHIDKVKENQMNFETTTQAGKLMHRFSEADLEKLMDSEMMLPPDDD